MGEQIEEKALLGQSETLADPDSAMGKGILQELKTTFTEQLEWVHSQQFGRGDLSGHEALLGLSEPLADEDSAIDKGILQELRTPFIEQLKWAYSKQLARGDLSGREVFLDYALKTGLEIAADEILHGKPIFGL